MVLLVAVLLTGCAAGQDTAASAASGAGFWLGLWHGLIIPVAFVLSLFTDRVGVYEVRNDGTWYDAGFVLGVSTVLGGVLAGRRRPRGRPGRARG